MGCHFCEKDSGIFTLVPVSPSGQALACIDCAVERNLYCKKHRVPHSGIALSHRNAHACLDCINERVESLKPEAGKFIKKLVINLDSKEFTKIVNWALQTHLTDSLDEWILRGIVMTAECEEKTPEQVIEEIIKNQSANAILPIAYAI